jgi:hypothetical protein
MAKVPEPDYDEVFSLYGQDPDEVARAVINTPADEELDRAESEGFSES